MTTFQSGTPFTVYDPGDPSLQGSAPEITGFSNNRPNLVSDPNNGPKTPDQWFNLGAFQALDPATQAGQFGTEGRNIVQGPGFADTDLALLKKLAVGENRTLQFRAEVFNLLNHPNFAIPDNLFGTPNFGRVLRAGPARLMQFGLKFAF